MRHQEEVEKLLKEISTKLDNIQKILLANPQIHERVKDDLRKSFENKS